MKVMTSSTVESVILQMKNACDYQTPKGEEIVEADIVLSASLVLQQILKTLVLRKLY